MSKVDELRALREARYAAMRRPASGPISQDRPEKRKQPVGTPVEVLCGHRSVSGKTCIRPLGHAEKNHRYGKGS